MNRPGITGQRLAAIVLLGSALLNYPLLFLFNASEGLFGIPPLYLYIFSVWAGLIGLMACVIERMED